MPKFPIYLDMSGRRAVVIGAGSVAVRKVQALHEAGARITVVASHVPSKFEDAFAISNVELVLATYRKDYLVGATLVIAATNDTALNQQVFHDCQELEILCNVVDKPEHCDFYTPAVVKRGDLQIAIGTDGNCPAYAGHIRRKLEEIFSETHGEFVDHLEKIRKRILKEVSSADQRKAILGRLASDESFEIFSDEGPHHWAEYAAAQMADGAAT
ncbi:MAG: bifunctional precorrin-2 dehydrogenase/sirohydrochlorin ferrochelatase [Planctomycetota bacterium]